MPTTEMIGFVTVVAALAIGFISLLRLIALFITHRTIRRAVDRDPTMVQPLLAQLAAPRRNGGEDRLAFILVAIGIAMIGGAVIAVDDPGVVRAAIGASLFPLLIGGALWLRFRAAKRAEHRAGAE